MLAHISFASFLLLCWTVNHFTHLSCRMRRNASDNIRVKMIEIANETRAKKNSSMRRTKFNIGFICKWFNWRSTNTNVLFEKLFFNAKEMANDINIREILLSALFSQRNEKNNVKRKSNKTSRCLIFQTNAILLKTVRLLFDLHRLSNQSSKMKFTICHW